jgi:hypothetical protein
LLLTSKLRQKENKSKTMNGTGAASEKKTVLILGPSDDRRCFDLYNWFRRKHPEWGFALAVSKLKLFDRLLYPGAIALPSGSPQQMLDSVALMKQYIFVYLPFFEDDIAALLLLKKHWPDNFRALLPTPESFETARDKYSFTARFQGMDLVPAMFDKQQLTNNFPAEGIVSKPRRGRGAIGMRFHADSSSLAKVPDDDVIQEKLGDGKSVTGVFFCCAGGKVLVQHQHRRLRTYPSSGGVSVSAEIIHIQEIAAKGEAMMQALNWEGLAMLEFLPHPADGSQLAIECNTRLWGSCLLGEYAGYAPVEAYICLCLGLPLPKNNIIENAQLVWYFPYQLLYVLRNPFSRLRSLFPEKNTAYISATGAGLFRALLFILNNVFNARKWTILFNKALKRR